MSCPQIWNIEQEKDREKEKIGGRPAKLNERERRQGSRARDKKNKQTNKQRHSGGDKMRNASGHQSKVKMGGSEKR